MTPMTNSNNDIVTEVPPSTVNDTVQSLATNNTLEGSHLTPFVATDTIDDVVNPQDGLDSVSPIVAVDASCKAPDVASNGDPATFVSTHGVRTPSFASLNAYVESIIKEGAKEIFCAMVEVESIPELALKLLPDPQNLDQGEKRVVWRAKLVSAKLDAELDAYDQVVALVHTAKIIPLSVKDSPYEFDVLFLHDDEGGSHLNMFLKETRKKQ